MMIRLKEQNGDEQLLQDLRASNMRNKLKVRVQNIQPVAKTEKHNKIYSESNNKSVLLTPIRRSQKISVA